MEISLSRFVQLTALIASGGTLVTACTVNDIHQDAATGGTTATGGSSTANTSTAATGGTSAVTTAGATSTSTTAAGATSTAGASSVGGASTAGGATAQGGSSAVAGASTQGGATTAGGTSNAAGATSVGGTTAQAGSSAKGGASSTGGTGGAVAGTTNGGSSGGAGTTTAGTKATGGTTTIGGSSTVGGATTVGGSSSCVSGDPAAEGMGFDCTTLSYYAEECADPTGEGFISTYGADICDQYAIGRVEAVKVLTDCLSKLTRPASGWCGAEHKAAVDACRDSMLTQTCKSTTAVTDCASIHSACSSVSATTCTADLSALGDEYAALVEPCMEGAIAASCEYHYRLCAGYPGRYMTVADSCSSLLQSCPAIGSSACTSTVDVYQSGTIDESIHIYLVECMQSEIDAGSTCSEAFTTCTTA